jgi:hypothetical protein
MDTLFSVGAAGTVAVFLTVWIIDAALGEVAVMSGVRSDRVLPETLHWTSKNPPTRNRMITAPINNQRRLSKLVMGGGDDGSSSNLIIKSLCQWIRSLDMCANHGRRQKNDFLDKIKTKNLINNFRNNVTAQPRSGSLSSTNMA